MQGVSKSNSTEWRYRAEKALPIPHRHITEKQKALVKELVARGFEVEFNENCKNLILDVPLNFRITGSEGESSRQLAFQAAGDISPSRILSEGEQTAVALADFLAEVKMNDSSIGIIFDDPVTSLDHMRKEVIARRLVEEAKARQVLVLTHDIIFVQHLASAALAAKIGFHGQTVSRPGGENPGWVGLDPFPHEHYEKEARKNAKKCEQDARIATGDNRGILLVRGYGCLRTAYEYFVQKKLFNDVIGRWRENIKYTISSVFIDPDTAQRVDERMALLSRYIEGHSHTPQSQEVPITPELLEQEITTFAQIRNDYETKRKAWEESKPKSAKVFS